MVEQQTFFGQFDAIRLSPSSILESTLDIATRGNIESKISPVSCKDIDIICYSI